MPRPDILYERRFRVQPGKVDAISAGPIALDNPNARHAFAHRSKVFKVSWCMDKDGAGPELGQLLSGLADEVGHMPVHVGQAFLVIVRVLLVFDAYRRHVARHYPGSGAD